jgi:hypothetical protein
MPGISWARWRAPALIIIGAAHVISAALAKQFALALGEPQAAHGTVQHRFGVAGRLAPGRGWRAFEKLVEIRSTLQISHPFWNGISTRGETIIMKPVEALG